MCALATQLASLYLLDETIQRDRIYTDAIYLEKPGPSRTTWKWQVGINYFSAQGDQRWWHDHRVPGGMAFSMNSVGHTVKAGIINRVMKELDSELSASSEDWDESHVDSLGKALILAMRTIAKAADATSGPATRLYDVSERPPFIPCPVMLPPPLVSRNHCEYFGWYHTDYTLPSEYFEDSAVRPPKINSHVLDFTYLFDARPGNPDHVTIGQGLVIRPASASWKNSMMEPIERDLESEPDLEAALNS
jgi:hypothetical protein